MIILTENKIDINRSISEVFKFVINMEDYGKQNREHLYQDFPYPYS
jgi:hypothetical protein